MTDPIVRLRAIIAEMDSIVGSTTPGPARIAELLLATVQPVGNEAMIVATRSNAGVARVHFIGDCRALQDAVAQGAEYTSDAPA
jgi:hypothetical protein